MNKLLVFLLFNHLLFAQNEIAVIDSRKILDTLPSRKIAIQKINAFEQEVMLELKAMNEEYFRLSTISSEGCFNGSKPIGCQIRSSRNFQKELEERYETSQEEILLYDKELNAPILARIQTAISTIALRKNLLFVFDKDGFIYRSDDVDITNDVIEELLLMEEEK